RTGCRFPDGEVVGMARARDALPPAQGGGGEDAVRSEPADGPRDVAAQLYRRGERAIGVPVEKVDLGHAQFLRCRALLRLTQRGHCLSWSVVEPAGVAASHDQV